MSRSAWGVAVTTLFAVATWVTPVPDEWRRLLIFLAWFALALSVVGWVLTHLQTTQGLNLTREARRPMVLFLIFAACGTLGVVAWLLLPFNVASPDEKSPASASARVDRLTVDYEAVTDTSAPLPEIRRTLALERHRSSTSLSFGWAAAQPGGHEQFQSNPVQQVPLHYKVTVTNDRPVPILGVELAYRVLFSYDDPAVDPKPIVMDNVAPVGDIAAGATSVFRIGNVDPVPALLLTPTKGSATDANGSQYEVMLVRTRTAGLVQDDRLRLAPRPATIEPSSISELAKGRDEGLRQGLITEQLRAARPEGTKLAVTGYRLTRNFGRNTLGLVIAVDNFTGAPTLTKINAEARVNGKPADGQETRIPSEVYFPANRGHDIVLSLTRQPRDFDAIWNGDAVIECVLLVDFEASTYVFRGRVNPSVPELMTVESTTRPRSISSSRD
jgi:hypothetical protein